MDVSIPSILISLGGKSLLAWALLLLHRAHMNHSFLGLFSISLTLVDTLLSLSLSVLHLQGDNSLLGLHLTRHHICLLVQIACYTYDLLLWPVVVLTGLDHYWTTLGHAPGPTLRHPQSGVKFTLSTDLGSASPPPILTLTTCGENANLTQDQHLGATSPYTMWRPPCWVIKIAYSAAIFMLWIVVLLYVFLLSSFIPVLGNQSPHQLQHCWVSTSTHTHQVAIALLLMVACAVLYVFSNTGSPMGRHRGGRMLTWIHPLFWSHTDRPGSGVKFPLGADIGSASPPPISWETISGDNTKLTPHQCLGAISLYTDRLVRKEVVRQVLSIFLREWALFLVFLPVCLVFQVGIPGYIGLNVPWLCLLNSFLLSVVFCVHCPAPQLAQGSVTSDGFCDWKLSPTTA